MPKLSVYVPDDLWEAVRKTHPQRENVSGLVQAGLRALLGSTDDLPSHLVRALPRPHPALSEISERLREEAEQVFREGYEAGIEMAKVMPWELLDSMSEYDFDLRLLEEAPEGRRIADPEAGEEGTDWADRLWTLLDIHEAKWGLPQRFGTTHMLGIRKALRDVWESVRSDLRVEPTLERKEQRR